MHVFRLHTNCETESQNDSYARKVCEKFARTHHKIELSFVSDSLGIMLFLRPLNQASIDMKDYITALCDIVVCAKLVNQDDAHITDFEVLD